MSYDYVICGGGTTGCIVARRLAENRNVTVCLIEAGPSDEGNDDVANIRKWASLLGTELDYKYSIEKQLYGSSDIIHNRAKVLGGCSSINVAIAFIPPVNDLDQWEQLGAQGWNSKATRKYYNKVFEKVNLQTVPPLNPLNQAFIDSCTAVNIPQIKMNSDTFVNEFSNCCGYFQLNVSGLNRCSSSRSYLHPISSLPSNLTILTNTTAIKIIIDQETMIVTGVLTNTSENIKVKKECILSTGAFDTPKLLLLSGIGPVHHLQQMNIPCILNLEGVGSNLMDHPECVIIWESNYPLPDPVIQRWETALFFKTQTYSTKPDLMFHFGIEAYDIENNLFGYPSEKHAFSIAFNVNKAKSRGHVQLRSNNYLDPPQIDCRYFTDEQNHDKAVMIAGLKLARKIIEQTPLQKWTKCELSPGAQIQTDQEIWDYCRKATTTLFHPAGTCKMGNVDNDNMVVVNSQLKVQGIKNLRIADTSVFPTMISVNPCITCMMIGEKCADMIKQD
ncbi:unnamed protein product [Adineta steineri]|uniref:Glucose-methanol-choline oxidoreductase N-terminal domain-containing protein n=1 Tax=Adineta steineri TaxID=433720 RepID=A0A819W1W6_9BILA|nr:unnamed protein product [Adineta steineri]